MKRKINKIITYIDDRHKLKEILNSFDEKKLKYMNKERVRGYYYHKTLKLYITFDHTKLKCKVRQLKTFEEVERWLYN